MKINKLFLVLPLLLFLVLALGCDNDDDGNAQDELGETEPGPESAMSMTVATGKVIPGNEECKGGIDGFDEGNSVEFEIIPDPNIVDLGNLENKTKGTKVTCGGNVEFDDPPTTTLSCQVNESDITGINNNEFLCMSVNFTFKMILS